MKFIDSFFFGASPLGVEGFPLGSRLRSDMGGRGGREVSRLTKEGDADAENSLHPARYNVDALIERRRQRALYARLVAPCRRDLHRVRGMSRTSRATAKIIPSGREDE